MALLRPARHHGEKKTAHAAEQSRPDVLSEREDWFEGQLDLDPARLVFLDETWAELARGHAKRSLGGVDSGRVHQHGPHAWAGAARPAPARRVPHGHYKTTTVLAGLRQDGMIAPFVIDGAIDRNSFETYVAAVLVPELRASDIVVMDNLSSHKGPRVRALIEAAGASLLYLPRYSPDFNPIENAFAKLKSGLRKAAERTIDALWARIGKLVGEITPKECANYFAAAGYDAD